MSVALTRPEFGRIFELAHGDSLNEHLLSLPPRTDAQGRTVRTVYVYGGALTTWHKMLLFGEDVNSLSLQTLLSVRARNNGNFISNLKGMDGLLVSVEVTTGLIVDILEVVEVKCNKAVGALRTTYYLAIDLKKAGILKTFRLVHQRGLVVKFKEEVERMRSDGHTVHVEAVHIHNDVIRDKFLRMYGDVDDMKCGVEKVENEYRDRRWVTDQLTCFLEAFKTQRVLRLHAETGSGKTNAYVTIITSKQMKLSCRLRCVIDPSLSSQHNTVTTFLRRGHSIKVCNCHTSLKTSFAEEEPELDAHSRCLIKNLICEEFDKLDTGELSELPVFSILASTLPLMLEVMRLKGEFMPSLLVSNETQELNDDDVIKRILQMPPFVKVLQVSATYVSYDISKQHLTGWCVQPYYSYSYTDAVRDGCIVPARVYIINDPMEGSRDDYFYTVCKNMIVLFPETSIITVARVEEAKSIATKLRDDFVPSQLFHKVFAVHSDMKQIDRRINGAASPMEALDYVRNNPTERIIIVACQMLNSSIDIPHAVNVFNLCTTKITPCAHHQRMGRVIRSCPGKQFGNYFVLGSQRDSVYAMRHVSVGNGDCITIYDDIDGTALDLASRSLLLASMEPRENRPSVKSDSVWFSQYENYLKKMAFPVLATMSSSRVQTKKDRRLISITTEELSTRLNFNGAPATISMNLREITDHIRQIKASGYSSGYTLPSSFDYPEYSLGAKLKPRGTPNDLYHEKISEEQFAVLDEECDRTPTKEEWDFVLWSDPKGCKKLHAAYMTGFARVKNTQIPALELKGFKMNARIEDLISMFRTRKVECGIPKDDCYMENAFRRFKLLQMKLVGHPNFQTRLEKEEEKVRNRNENKGKRKGAPGTPSLLTFFGVQGDVPNEEGV